MSNNFDGAVLIDDGVGSTAAPGGYFGLGRAAGTMVSSGPRWYSGTGNPNTVVTAPIGSLWCQTDSAGLVFVNTNGTTGWSQLGPTSGPAVLSSIDTTATPAFQWTMADNAAAAVSLGAAGALSMLVFDTTNGAERLIVGAADGMRLNDSAQLTFGTGGDIVFTPDGTNVAVTAPLGGFLGFADDTTLGFGTAGPTSPSARLVYAFGSSLVINGRALSGVGGGAATTDFLFATDSFTVTDAAVGGASGGVILASGPTDSTNAGGTGGSTGQVNITSGAAASTAGTSGSSGNVTLASGPSADANSGNVTVQTGTAGGTRGSFVIDAPTVDLANVSGSSPVAFSIRDNSSSSVAFAQSSNPYIVLDTTNTAEAIAIGARTATQVQQRIIVGGPASSIEADGINLGSRFVVAENFAQRPLLAASIAATNASKTTEIQGTNAADAGSLFASTGGIQITTTAADNDQMIITGNTTGADNSQCPLLGTAWNTASQLRIKVLLRVVDTANVRFKIGLMLTNAMDVGTDADQVYFGFSQADNIFGTGANWAAGYSIAGADTDADTGIAVAAGLVQLVIDIDSLRVARFFINRQLVATSAALTSLSTLKPFIGLQTESTVARTATVVGLAVSQVA